MKSINMKIKLKGVCAVQLKLVSDTPPVREVPPASASVVTDLRGFKWDDEAWMKDFVKDSAIVNSRFLFMRPVFPNGKNAAELVKYLKNLKYTHVELHPGNGIS